MNYKDKPISWLIELSRSLPHGVRVRIYKKDGTQEEGIISGRVSVSVSSVNVLFNSDHGCYGTDIKDIVKIVKLESIETANVVYEDKE